MSLSVTEWNNFKEFEQKKQKLKEYTMSVELPINDWFDLDLALGLVSSMLNEASDPRIISTVKQKKKIQAVIRNSIHNYEG